MNHSHPLGILASSQEAIEAVHPEFLKEGLIQARQKTVNALTQIRAEIKEGITEDDARRLALTVLADLGASKHWHKPYIRFGAGTALTFHDPLQTDYRLKLNDPYYIDLGPVWADPELGLEYEGDYGDTFVFGENREADLCAQSARDLFVEAKTLWQSKRLPGEELYAFLKNRALELGYRLIDSVEGHRLSDFPHHKYSKERLAKTSFVPSDSLWVLEIQITEPKMRFGAFFEDIL